MNISEKFRELRRAVARRATSGNDFHRRSDKPQQLEFSLPQIRRSRLLRLGPNATR